MMKRLLILSVLLGACRDKNTALVDTGVVNSTDTPTADVDADGYSTDEDCDDANSLVHPGAEELCDGADNDCDGEVDEGVTTAFFADDDGDGFGDAGSARAACEAPAGYVATGTDCDDSSAESYPGAGEQCDNEDNDCDGAIDEDVREDWYADADGDGFGAADSAYDTCDPPPGYVSDSSDCDDTDETAYPGGEEVCDEADNDCDGDVDEDVTSTWYQDSDSDGFGDADRTTEACTPPTGYARQAGDCNDGDGAISPNAVEICDDTDNDCDGDIDGDAVDQATFYVDSDSDGFGDADRSTTGCDTPSGYTSDGTDCDDGRTDISPSAEEVCDGEDNDCDGDIDTDATDLSTFYADSDGDGYGGTSSVEACEQPSGFADNSDDCDDGESARSPGEVEVCDALDNDCDGDTDEGLTSTFYLDADGDGYGGTRSTTACEAPSGYVADGADCDDLSEDSYPGGEEACDGEDNDCDGDVDNDAVDAETFYADSDSDGFGDADRTATGCEAPSGYTDDSTDCNDLSEDSYPGSEEVCDGNDNDCSGLVDDGLLGDGAACAAESCAAVLADDSAASDGDYWLDPDGSGAVEHACDMTTDGGGWTEVLRWSREDDGDSQADFEALLNENLNAMGDWSSATRYIQWSDYDGNGDVLDYDYDVIVPNDGEVLFVVDYYGYSMEQSGMWFYVTAGGSEQNLRCAAASTTISNNCFTGTSGTLFDATEETYIPDYTCSATASGNLSWDATTQHDFSSDEVTRFHLTSLMCDNSLGDYSRLYDFEVWVR